jgi:nucleoside-diphosphate-sugar epimerase
MFTNLPLSNYTQESNQKLAHFYAHKKILITGGAGFIGSHIADQLVGYNAQVTILDNLRTGSLKNIEQIRDRVTFISGNIKDQETCYQATKNQDIIIHCAALVSVQESLTSPDECYAINVTGTQNLLHSAAHQHISGFIFSSSAAVYGNKEGCCHETDLCNPCSPYGYSKYLGELLCQQYAQLYNMPAICLRYFNVYGDRQIGTQATSGVIARFHELMKQNQPITFYGDGQQTRDFIPVSLVAQANLYAGILATDQKLYRDIALNGCPRINIATNTPTSLKELFNTLKQQYPNYNQTPICQTSRAGDIICSYGDATRLKQLYSRL